MLKNLKPKHKFGLKRIFIRCVALLFVIYALADISILQGYCGNESVGIPPAHHFSKDTQDSAESSQTDFQHSHDDQHHEDSENDSHEHLSFCSSNIMFEVFVFEFTPVIYAEINSQNSISYENKHSNSELRNLFRPPQIA